MSILSYTLDADDPQSMPMGLIVLQSDETIEPEFRRYFADATAPIYASRIPSGLEVSQSSLTDMEELLPASASLFPVGLELACVGYGCTSASSLIGSERVEELVRSACNTRVVTNPLRAAVACASRHGVSKFALLSPYVEAVNEPLRAAFKNFGLSTEVFGTFAEAEESKVVRISKQSVVDAAIALGRDDTVEGVFLSCTNLRTIDAIPEIEDAIGKPVLSSNQSLAWHMRSLSAQAGASLA